MQETIMCVGLMAAVLFDVVVAVHYYRQKNDLKMLRGGTMELNGIKCSVCPKKMEWIPVSEQLPHIHERVLVCTQSKKIAVSYMDIDTMDARAFWVVNENVTAWMPLPKAYEE